MTLGTMATDAEMRLDFDKLRKDRLAKMTAQVKQDGLGGLLSFDPDTIRYITGTKLNDWTNNKLARCCLLVADHAPVLFEIGSAIETKKKLSPWIKDCIYPMSGSMRGTFPEPMVASTRRTSRVTSPPGCARWAPRKSSVASTSARSPCCGRWRRRASAWWTASRPF